MDRAAYGPWAPPVTALSETVYDSRGLVAPALYVAEVGPSGLEIVEAVPETRDRNG